ncbi:MULTISPECIES: SDR family oxidoreductase [Actinomycetes]|uniref:SDR family NAD(P)-dependent oxidoreductase n=1 Tax=Actinomycetes TaxID=1760 RepID=UPI00068BC711|nr:MULTISPECIES: SDR family oxidoreductase [Actinomycetes]
MNPNVVGRMAGKVVVVTGAARGQGAAEAQALATQGARVVATDITCAEDLDPDAFGDAIVYRQLDVGDPAAWTALGVELLGAYGEVHGLVNNAGLTHRARLMDVELADWERMFRVNTTGALLGIQTLAPLMKPGASIVTIGSIAAVTPHYTVAYTASKWAVRGLSKVASLELGPRGIRVNLVHPGYIETPMVANAPTAFRQANIDSTPLGTVGSVDDIANLIVFLLSDESTYISGAEIAVDGGLSSQGGVKFLSDAVMSVSTAITDLPTPTEGPV